jgi:hypothetical protein
VDGAAEEGAVLAATDSWGVSVERLHATFKTTRATRTNRIIESFLLEQGVRSLFLNWKPEEYTVVRPVLGRGTHAYGDCAISPLSATH